MEHIHANARHDAQVTMPCSKAQERRHGWHDGQYGRKCNGMMAKMQRMMARDMMSSGMPMSHAMEGRCRDMGEMMDMMGQMQEMMADMQGMMAGEMMGGGMPMAGPACKAKVCRARVCRAA